MWVSLGLLQVSFRVSLGFHLRFLQGFFRVSFRGSLVFHLGFSVSSGFQFGFHLGFHSEFFRVSLGVSLRFHLVFHSKFRQAFIYGLFRSIYGFFRVHLVFHVGGSQQEILQGFFGFHLGPLRFHVGHKQERIKQNNQGFMQEFFRVSRFFKIYISLDFHFGFLQGVGRVSCRV